MIIDQRMSNGLVYRWSYVDGVPRCIQAPVSPGTMEAELALKVSEAIQQMEDAYDAWAAAPEAPAAEAYVGAIYRLRTGEGSAEDNDIVNAAFASIYSAKVNLSLTALKQSLKETLADIRWHKESAGTTFNGAPWATDETAQRKFLGATLAAVLDPTYTVLWKLGGQFITLNAAHIVAAASKVRTHIQECFDNEKRLSTLIDQAVSVDTLNSIDLESGWPT